MPISIKAEVGQCPSTAPILADTRASLGPTCFESTIAIVGGDLPCFCRNCVNADLNVLAASVPYGMSTKLAAVPGLTKPRDRGSFGSRAGICQSKCSAAGAAGDSGADAGALAAADAGLLPVPNSPAPDCNRFSIGPTVERKRSAWS